jgi:hypothetical protein
VQVAEFAAPIDAEDLALYVYVLGRVFKGASEFDECLAVIENNNTGILTIRKLQAQYEYVNLWQSDTSLGNTQTPKHTSGIGFFSGPSTVPLLHARSRSIVMRRDVEVRSQHLIKEYSDAIVKITGTGSSADEQARAIVVRERFIVPVGGGRHDDRMIASFLAYVALFDITESGESSGEGGYDAREQRTVPELAGRDATAEDQQRQWNDLVGEYLGDAGGDLMLGGHYPDCALDCRGEHAEGDDGESEFWENEDEEGDDRYAFGLD